MNSNLACMLAAHAERRPQARVGLADDPMGFAAAFAAASGFAARLLAAGVAPGEPCVLVGPNSNRWLVTWMGLQLAGARTCLMNPAMPVELAAEVLRPLDGCPVVYVDDAGASIPHDGPQVRIGSWSLDEPAPTGGDPLPGLRATGADLAGYMLTSGTSGVPKLVAQSHEYFLALGRYVADVLALTERDTVLTPLPLFHINPLGYAVIGGLVAGADVLVGARFSASGFWPTVRGSGATVAVLHGPPIEILSRATGAEDAAGHRLRAVLYADPAFLRRFDIPLGLSVYGSTEGGGLSACYSWRPSDAERPHPDAVRYGGHPRLGFEHAVVGKELLVRSSVPNLLASGYVLSDGSLQPIVGPDGAFHTGDAGRVDDRGGVVFSERMSESMRVRGEFVPFRFVEDRFRALPGVRDVAAWKRAGRLSDEELVLYLEADAIPLDEVVSISGTLPAFMRPSALARLAAFPRDTGVGKVRRRELSPDTAVEFVELDSIATVGG